MSPADPTAPGTDPDDPAFVYDEMAYFEENLAEYGIDWAGPVPCRRVELHDGVSALRWGTGPIRAVFLHGAAQNAHTWDTVLLALGCPSALAIDLPGHGHSAHRDDGLYDPRHNASTIGTVLAAMATVGEVTPGITLVGMSLGGLTANALAAAFPDVVRNLLVVDITPGVNADKAKAITDFVAGPQSFDGFGEIFDRTVEFNPTRTQESLRRGILHNAQRQPDGTWRWRYDRRQLDGVERPDVADLWADIAATVAPYVFVRGADSPVVDDDDVAELTRLRPDVESVVIEGAGHSIQGDRPIELAALIAPLLDGPNPDG